MPVNLKLILEAMEESGSEGLDELIIAEKDGFLKDVDAICISGWQDIVLSCRLGV